MANDMERNIWIYGNPDKSDLGFRMPGKLTDYLSNDIFAKESGRYRYTQGKNADVIVLSRDGLAYGHFDIEEKVTPTDADRKAYPKVKYVYIVTHGSRQYTVERKLGCGKKVVTLAIRQFAPILGWATEVDPKQTEDRC